MKLHNATSLGRPPPRGLQAETCAMRTWSNWCKFTTWLAEPQLCGQTNADVDWVRTCPRRCSASLSLGPCPITRQCALHLWPSVSLDSDEKMSQVFRYFPASLPHQFQPVRRPIKLSKWPPLWCFYSRCKSTIYRGISERKDLNLGSMLIWVEGS